MKNKAFLCAPRRFLIITVVYLLIQSVGIYLFFESLQYEEIGHLEAILNIIAPPAPLWIAAFFRRYDWLSIVRLHEDKIVLWAMFTRRSYSYADMKYIGIDYSLIEGRPEFWIYFSTNPVPVEYTHKIAAYRINKGFLRILYTPKNYELLIRNTPPEISRLLRKCYSTVLAYKADR